MNKQIEDLARKCGAWDQVYGDRNFMIDEHFDIAKFAKVIVRECAQHALDFNNNNQSLPDKVMRGNLDRVQDYIKDRMGVEE
jgi:hypothetical protein